MPPGRPVSSFCSRAQASAKQGFGVGRPALCDDARREGSDDRRLVGAEVGVERHQLWGDGVGHDELYWSVVEVAAGGSAVRQSVTSSDEDVAWHAGVGACVPGRDAAAAPYATALESRSAGSSPATSASR